MSNLDHFYAYPPEFRGLEVVSRMSGIKRWHMVDTTRTQTLAEHSANVALLARHIAITCPDMYFGPAHIVSDAALCHDTDEAFTGDLPTPTKPYIEGLGQLVRGVIPPEYLINGSTEHIYRLIKLCDEADGIRFVRLHGVGMVARHAQEGIENRMASRCEYTRKIWPEIVFDHVMSKITFYAYELS